MSRSITKRWLDLNELGQHHADIDAVLGEFPYISQCTVTVGDKVIDLTPLLTKETTEMILEELAIDEREYYSEQAEDSKFDAMMEKAA